MKFSKALTLESGGPSSGSSNQPMAATWTDITRNQDCQKEQSALANHNLTRKSRSSVGDC
jgi:hypothetical protein